MKRKDKDNIVLMMKFGPGFLYLALNFGFFRPVLPKQLTMMDQG